MKEKRLYTGLSWLIVLNGLIKPVWIFAIDRKVQLLAGHEAYGTYFSLFNLTYVLSFAADLGLTGLLNRQLAAEEKSTGLRQLVHLKAFLLLAYVLLCLLAGWITGIDRWDIFIKVIAIQLLTSLLLFGRNTVTALQLFSTDALLSVLDKALMIITCGILIYVPRLFGPLSLDRFLDLQVAALGVTVAAAGTVLYLRRLPRGPSQPPATIFRQVIPFAALTLLTAAHYRLDGFLLERLHPEGAFEAGLYATAFRLLDAANTAGYMAGAFLLPFLARHRGDEAAGDRAILTVRHLLLFAATDIVTFSAVFAPWMQELLYHTSDPRSIRILPLCLGALPGLYLVHVYGSVLIAEGRMGALLRVLLPCLLLNIALNGLLIPRLGAEGCAWAALLSQSACGLTLFRVATRASFWSRAVAALLQYGLPALLLLLLFRLGQWNGWPVWNTLVAAIVLTALLLGIQLGFLKKRMVQ